MSPVQPHTIQKEARSCESCHASSAALGYGINDGKYFGDPSKDLIVDLMTAEGDIIPQNYVVQKPKIENLHMDWSRFVDENGRQLQTVGHHFKLSEPLSNAVRKLIDRRSVCLSCHKIIPDKDLAVSLMVHVAQFAGYKIDRDEHDAILSKNLLLVAWVQILFILFVLIVAIYLLYRFVLKKERVK